MTLGELHELLTTNGIYVSDNNDFELLMPDGLPIVGIYVNQKTSEIYLSDTTEGVTIEI